MNPRNYTSDNDKLDSLLYSSRIAAFITYEISSSLSCEMSCLMLKQGATLIRKDYGQGLKWLWLAFPLAFSHEPNIDASVASHQMNIILQLQISESSGSI